MLSKPSIDSDSIIMKLRVSVWNEIGELYIS